MIDLPNSNDSCISMWHIMGNIALEKNNRLTFKNWMHDFLCVYFFKEKARYQEWIFTMDSKMICQNNHP